MDDRRINAEGLVATPDDFRSLERSRLRALVDRDMALAFQLHASDFQLITPGGIPYSRERYLHDVETRALSYLKWEPQAIDVRLFPGVALLRYRAELRMGASAAEASSFACWHTDSYELHNGAWEVVWSQATLIR